MGAIADRVSDILVLVVFCSISLIVVIHPISWNILIILCLVVSFLLVIGIRYWEIFCNIIIKCSVFLVPKKLQDSVDFFVNEIESGLSYFSKRRVLGVAMLSIVCWILYAVPLYVLGTALDLGVCAPILISYL